MRFAGNLSVALLLEKNMSEIGSLRPQVAKHNPASVFASPLDIVDEIMMTRGEKIATLERWRLSVLQDLAAADDGMRTAGVSATHSDTLDMIEQALSRLRPQARNSTADGESTH